MLALYPLHIGGDGFTCSPPLRADPWIGGVFGLRTQFVVENPAVAARFVKALERAVDYINNHPVEYKRILTKYIPLDETIALQTTNIPYWRLHEIDKDQVQLQTDLLFERGVLRARVNTREMYYDK